MKRLRKPYDKHGLYERAVQRPQFDIDFVNRVFTGERARVPLALREDFCGTAFISAEWVRSHPKRTALGLDLHAETLAWGRKWNIAPLEQEDALAVRVARFTADFDGKPVPRPPFWSGYRLAPSMIEFWIGRPGRLHERIRYDRASSDAPWTEVRLYP